MANCTFVVMVEIKFGKYTGTYIIDEFERYDEAYDCTRKIALETKFPVILKRK